MYIVNLGIFHQFEGPLVKLSKSRQSDQMTMPARRASTFCLGAGLNAQSVFSQPGIFVNSWNLRTFV